MRRSDQDLPKYRVCGLDFTLLPTTNRNRRNFDAVMEKRYDDDAQDRFWYDVFTSITAGPHDQVDIDDLDSRVVETMIADFLPQQRLTILQQIGFLPS